MFDSSAQTNSPPQYRIRILSSCLHTKVHEGVRSIFCWSDSRGGQTHTVIYSTRSGPEFGSSQSGIRIRGLLSRIGSISRAKKLIAMKSWTETDEAHLSHTAPETTLMVWGAFLIMLFSRGCRPSAISWASARIIIIASQNLKRIISSISWTD